MARFSLLALAALAFLAGCQQHSAPIASLPAPNLDGPILSPAPAPAPAQPLSPPPAAQAARPPRAFDVPESWIPSAPPVPWRWIVIHHSASPAGCAASMDRGHRLKGWDELGYHFVIGNGTASGDGQVEVGSRWPKQKWGAHAKTVDNRYNEQGIGICLVGNFDIERPTARQLQSLARLTNYLMAAYHIPPSNVIGHRECKPTDCPGRHMNILAVRRMLSPFPQESSLTPPLNTHPFSQHPALLQCTSARVN